MASSSQLYKEMTGLEKLYKSKPIYTKDDLYRDLTEKMGGFAPMHEQAAAADTQAAGEQARLLANFRDAGFGAGYGPSAMQQLSSAQEQQQRGYSNADAIRGQVTSMGGRTEDIAGSLANRYAAEREDAWRQYQAKMSMYESQANREQQARLSGGSGGGGGGFNMPKGFKLQKNADNTYSIVPDGSTTPTANTTQPNMFAGVSQPQWKQNQAAATQPWWQKAQNWGAGIWNKYFN